MDTETARSEVAQLAIEYPLDIRGNAMLVAQILTDQYPETNLKYWQNQVYRFKKRNEVTQSDIYYNESTDTYITYLTSAGQNLILKGDVHRAMKEAYSNATSKGATINEIARQFNMPRPWFEEYKRRHGWTHDMLPYTDEEILDGEEEDLVEDLILRARRNIYKKFEHRKWKEIQEAADKWFELEETLTVALEKLQKAPQNVPKLKLNESKNPYAAVISPTDFHWGKYGWIDEVGETYNFEEARERLMERTSELISWMPTRPEKIILATGSDWFHVDNDNGTTTRGTPQDMCGSPAEILISGCHLAREHIDLLRQVAPVEVVFMAGNHDRHSALALMLYLSAAYENVDDVSITLDPKIRQYRQYGKTLLGFTHGDKVAKNKLPTLMSKEKRELWGQTESHIWFTGHLHHQALHELDGGLVVQLPSLAAHDRYHYREGYTCAKAGLAAHIIDKELGLIGSLFSPVR